MKRAPVVAGATILGLAGVLSFHTKPATIKAASLTPPSSPSPATPTSTSGPTATNTPATGSHGAGGTTTTGNGSGTPGATGTTAPPTRAPVPTTRAATGDSVDYHYGVLSVKVTVSGTRITDVQIASLQDDGSNRSQSIDQQSIPILEQESLSAQSANIQGVSGASYTSAGFQQSLQSALKKLGVA
jgi:hypothetical protein